MDKSVGLSEVKRVLGHLLQQAGGQEEVNSGRFVERETVIYDYQQEIAAKDDVIRELNSLLCKINTASPRHSVHDKSRSFIESGFNTVPRELHALQSMYGNDDWKSDLDGVTQLMLTLLMSLLGLADLSLQRTGDTGACFVNYKAFCCISSGSLGMLADDEWAFVFSLLFEIPDTRTFSASATSSMHQAVVSYNPIDVDNLPLPFVAGLGRFSKRCSFPIGELSRFYSNLRGALVGASSYESALLLGYFSMGNPLATSTVTGHTLGADTMPGKIDFEVEVERPWNLPLVQCMPWFTDVVVSLDKRASFLPADLLHMSHSLVAEFGKASSNESYRGVMFNRATLHPNQKSVEPLPALLFGLRLLDVATAVHGTQGSISMQDARCSRSSSVTVVPRTVFEGQTSKLRGVRSLGDKHGWTRIIIDLQFALKNSRLPTETTLCPLELQSSPARQLVLAAMRQLEVLSRRDMNVHLLKVIQNLVSAAFFINYMLQTGSYDFPPLWQTLVDQLRSIAKQEDVQCDIGSSLPPITRIRQSLFLALAVSPLILLCDITTMSNNLTRLHMIRAWYHYGTIRPPVLRRSESLLWKKIFSIARGLLTPVDALHQYIQEAVPLIALAQSEAHFFDPDVGCRAQMPIALTYLTTQVPRGFIEKNILGGANGVSTLKDPDKEARSQYTVDCAQPVCDVSLLLTSDLWDGTVEDDSRHLGETLSSPPVVAEDPRRLCRATVKDSDTVKEGSDAVVMSVITSNHPRSRKRLLTMSDMLESGGGSSGALHDATSAAGVPQVAPSNVFLRPYLAPAKRDASTEQWIDNLSTMSPCNSKRRIRGAAYLLACLDGKLSGYWPSSYLPAQLDLLHALVEQSNMYQQKCGNLLRFVVFLSAIDNVEARHHHRLFAATKQTSIGRVRICTVEEHSRLQKSGDLGEVLVSEYIVVNGSRAYDQPPTVASLLFSAIGSLSARREAVDVSQQEENPAGQKNYVAASLNDYLAQVRKGDDGKIMRALRHPLSHTDGSSIPSFSRREWHFVATADVCHIVSFTEGGFNTDLTVKTGTLLAFLGASADNEPIIAASSILKRRQLGNPLGDYDVLGILLRSGDGIVIKGGTPYVLFTLEHTVCRGNHFYSTATLQCSYQALVRAFFTDEWSTSSYQSSRSDWYRILSYFHVNIVENTEKFLSCCSMAIGKAGDLPDILTVDGLQSLFSLFAVIDISVMLFNRSAEQTGNIDHESYGRAVSSMEDILSVLDERVEIRRRGECVPVAVRDLWLSFIVQQWVALVYAGRCAAVFAASRLHLVMGAVHGDLKKRHSAVFELVMQVLTSGEYLLMRIADALDGLAARTYGWTARLLLEMDKARVPSLL
ncbi:hypothetical protein VNI00_012689 [Paramarasmius palmivorus]|uniref:Uncharacterized protein n=1 Tax=Paramarasmius palmivorus TaxID=297713 RepID=A0AAW0C565_9AGAR